MPYNFLLKSGLDLLGKRNCYKLDFDDGSSKDVWEGDTLFSPIIRCGFW